MKISDLLKRKGSRLFTCGAATSVGEASQLIYQNHIGALPVTDDAGKLSGIFTERDLAKAVAKKGKAAVDVKISEFMTGNVTVVTPDSSVREALRTMGTLTIRHLPVVEGGKLIGVISQRDVLKAILDDTELEVGVLRDVALRKL